jgi:hypothetical protein
MRRGARRNHDWDDRKTVAPAVKVFQVQSIVMCLLDRRGIESCGAYLEFQNEDGSSDYQDDISSLAHPGDGKLKKDMTHPKITHGLPHDLDLRKPGTSLLLLKEEPVGTC